MKKNAHIVKEGLCYLYNLFAILWPRLTYMEMTMPVAKKKSAVSKIKKKPVAKKRVAAKVKKKVAKKPAKRKTTKAKKKKA